MNTPRYQGERLKITPDVLIYNGNNGNNGNNPLKSTGYERTTPEREREQQEHADRVTNNATRDTRTRPRGHITHTHTRTHATATA